MSAKIFILVCAFALIAAFEKCENCVARGEKFFLSLSGQASCGKREFRAQLSSKDSAGCISLDKLIAKLNIQLQESSTEKFVSTTSSASALSPRLSYLENTTKSLDAVVVTTSIPLPNSTDIYEEILSTVHVQIPNEQHENEATTSSATLVQNFTSALNNSKAASSQNNMTFGLTTKAAPILQTTAVSRTHPKRCIQTTKTGEDRLNRIWRSVARSYLLIERALKRNFPVPAELLLWQKLNPLSQMGDHAEEFYKEKLMRRQSTTHFVC